MNNLAKTEQLKPRTFVSFTKIQLREVLTENEVDPEMGNNGEPVKPFNEYAQEGDR